MSGVVFDLDGTLIDSLRRFHQVIAQEITQRTGQQVRPEDVEKRFHHNFKQVYEYFGVTSPKDMQEIEDQVHKQEQEWVQFSLLPGIMDVFKFLNQHNIPRYVWTFRDRKSTEKILDFLDLTHFFQGVYTRCDGHPKPSGQGILSLVGDTDTRKLIVIGDSLSDYLGAHEIGASFIAALWCHPTHREKFAHIKQDTPSERIFMADNVESGLKTIKQWIDIPRRDLSGELYV
jgi:phosphoglycolate phosphatase-like HAD superfamily hydrolase